MVKGVAATLCRLYVNCHIFLGLGLTYVFVKGSRAKVKLVFPIHFLHFGSDYSVFKILFS